MSSRSFVLSSYYQHSKAARLLNFLIIGTLILLVLALPLPFGSVESHPMFLMQAAASFCFLLWVGKLVFCGSSSQLREFRHFHTNEKEVYKRAPFFHRWSFLGVLCRILTLGKWPKKYDVRVILNGSEPPPLPRLTYYSVFGFPVRRTGVEPIVLCFIFLFYFNYFPCLTG